MKIKRTRGSIGKRRIRGAAAILAASIFLSGELMAPLGITAAEPESPQAVEMTEEITAEEPETLPEKDSDLQTGNASDIEYVYLEKSSITQDDIDRVLVSLKDDGLKIKNAVLILADADGNKQEFEMSSADGANLVFEVSGLKNGLYMLDSIVTEKEAKDSVSGNTAEAVDAIISRIELSSIEGIADARIGVNCEVVYDEDLISELSDENGEEIIGAEASDGDVLTEADSESASGVVVSDVSSAAGVDLQAQADMVAGALSAQAALIPDQNEEAVSSEEAGRRNKKVVVVLDPGHDDSHAGARSHGLLEEKMTLTVANYCKAYLEANYKNVTVYMTRSSGSCPYPGTSSGDDNAARVAAAANVGANAYVSIHFNTTAASSGSSCGAMVFYPNGNYNAQVSADGRNLAVSILQELIKLGLNNNGVKIYNSQVGDTYPDGSLADYYGVIRRSKLYGFPGIIIEHAFLNNSGDAAFLSSEENLKKLGEADGLGIGKALSLNNDPVVEEDGEIINNDDYTLECRLNAKEKKCTITLTGVPDDVEGVHFHVYSSEYDMDDLTEYDAKEDDDEEGQWAATLKIKDHASAGEYMVFAYVLDEYGKAEKVATGRFNVSGPSAGEIKVTKVDKSKQTMQICAEQVEAPASVASVKFRITNLSGTKKTEEVKAKKKSGKYQATSNLKLHGNASGKYRIELRIKDKTDIEYTKTVTYKMGSGTTTQSGDPSFTSSLSSNQKKLTMKAKNLDALGKVKEVRYKITSLDGDKTKYYTGKKKLGGKYTVKVSIGDFGFAGVYQITGYAKMSDDSYKVLGPMQTVKVSEVTAAALSYASAGETSTLMTISTGGSAVEVKSVSVKAWPKVKKSAVHTYKAEGAEGVYKCTVDASNHKNKTGTYIYEVTVKLNNGLTKKLLRGVFEIGKDPVMYAVAGASEVTLNQLVSYYQSHAAYPSFYSGSDASSLRKFCKIYMEECQAEGIRAEVAFCQAMKETNFLRYGGDVNIAQYNFAGLGATGGGAKGNSYPNVRTGVRAQVQHLKAYANEEALVNKCVDDRFTYVSRGSAMYVEWLGIPDNPTGKGWATDTNYGGSILTMISELKSN